LELITNCLFCASNVVVRAFGTLLHCFSDRSLNWHSLLSELKMSSFGPYAGAKTRCPSTALSAALCWRSCQMSNSSSTSWTRDWYTRCWTRQ